MNYDYLETYKVLMPLTATTRKQATDTFNTIVSNNEYLMSFLEKSKKIYPSLGWSDLNFLIKKYNLPLDYEEKTHAKNSAYLYSNKETYQLSRHDIHYKNMNTSLVLFYANIVVGTIDKNFEMNNCCDFGIMDSIICYPINLNGQCNGTVLINIISPKLPLK